MQGRGKLGGCVSCFTKAYRSCYQAMGKVKNRGPRCTSLGCSLLDSFLPFEFDVELYKVLF